MFLVWFSRINFDKSRVFNMYNRGKARLVHMGDYGTALTEGSYPAAALARIASLEGPADESDFPYLSRRAFANVGYSVSNPPTHREAEDVGLIPFDYSTPQELYYAKDTVTPRHDLMMTDALYAASRIAPSSFANQREEYARQNSVNRNVLKSLIKTYGAAMKERPENLRIYEHDPLGWCNSYTFNTSEIWGANVFRIMTTGETLHSVSFYTPFSNMRADVFVYDLGASFDGGSPRAGTLLASTTTTLPYAGYHSVELTNASLTERQPESP